MQSRDPAGRVLAVDWGRRRIGLAVSDPTGTVQTPLPTLLLERSRDAATRVAERACEEGADLVVLGLPVEVSGKEGPSSEQVRRLGKALERMGLSVRYQDERFSSEEALEFLRERGERRPSKARIDQVAALLLLRAFLEEGEPQDA